MQFAQRMLLLAAFLLASASWFHGQSPAGHSQKNASLCNEPEGPWVGTLEVGGTRLRFSLAMQKQSGSAQLPPDPCVN